MEDRSNPFNQLSDEDQAAAIDVAISAVLIGLRMPSAGKPLYDYIATEFAASRGLPANIVRYALRNLGRDLYDQDWTMTITKTGPAMKTHFTPDKPFQSDGEIIQHE